MSDKPSLDPERWRRLDALLDHVFELDPSEVSAYLDQACGDDAELRAEVEALLAADAAAEGLLEGSAAEVLPELLDRTLDASSPGVAADGSVGRPDPLVGQLLGPYRVEEAIGGGGMGDVYRAVDTRLERTVALKLLPRAWSRDARAKERFLREAKAASALDHPNLCTVHDVGETDDGRLFLVMAYYEGETLARRLGRGALPPREARDIALQVARGLERAHRAGIVHRDIKPANLVITAHGEVKILDFGIAKVADETALTRTGMSPGTPAYMAPEQASGGEIDGRADLWALGAVLYEMLGGRRAFVGENALSLLDAILRREPEPVEALRPELPADLVAVVARLLRKNPRQRFADAAELVEALESGVTHSGTGPLWRWGLGGGGRSPEMRHGLAFALAILVVGALVYFLPTMGWWRRGEGSPPPDAEATRAQAEQSTTVLAVLDFENTASVPELEWLGRGLAELLITDLAQSAELRLVGSRRLAQALGEARQTSRVDDDGLSIETTRRLAEATGATHLLRGSFLRSGEQLRLSYQLEDPLQGTLLGSERFEGKGEESLFTLVDLLSADLRSELGSGVGTLGEAGVRSFTNESLAAWRAYSEGVALSRTMRRDEAVARLEEAVAIDPGFALALAHLATLHDNQGHAAEAREYRRRAVELADRLPLDQRYAIEASYYGARWTTLHRAIAVWREGLRQYPDRWAWRNNLARRYAFLERYDEAIEELEKLIAIDQPFVGDFADLANALAAQGHFEAGERVLESYAERQGESWFVRFVLAWHQSEWGRLDQADRGFRRAAELEPGDPVIVYGRWRLAVLREAWQEADALALRLAAADDPFARWRGAVSLARNALYRGNAGAALGHFEEALDAYGEANAFTALVRCWIAELHLARGDAAAALAALERARREGREEWPELRAAFLAALAHQQGGDEALADIEVARLRERFRSHPNKVEERQLLHLEGLLALARGDVAAAVSTLAAAVKLLPPEGVEFHFHLYPQHVPLWGDLARALLADGRAEEALPWLDRAINSGAEHLEQPLAWVRAHLLRARALHALGRPPDDARPALETYLEHWGEGTLDPGDVAWAKGLASRHLVAGGDE